jgi:hypothetical protein
MGCGGDWISVTPPERRAEQIARQTYRVADRTLTYKRVIGNALRSRTDETEATEVAIAAAALNRMLELGRPNCIRIA